LSPAFRNTTKRDDAKRGDDLDRERERRKERERERERFEERKRKVRDRPTFCTFSFYAGINGDILKALFRNNHKKEPFKNISVERKEDVHQPLKTTTTEEEEEEEEENDRENDAREGI